VAFLTGSPARNLHGRPFLYFIFLHRWHSPLEKEHR
jgi:hypothetical protein